MGMMNKDGRSIVSGVLLDPSIYPPGESTLLDPISHWYGYSASHKWLFGTITLLFVFRPLLMDIKSMTCSAKRFTQLTRYWGGRR
ncbi:unnamed protein product [Ascophyllum nodosum]